MRIQFTVSEEEYAAAARAAEEAGYPNMSAYCRDCVLEEAGAGRAGSLPAMWDEAERKVRSMPPGTEFRLRDLVPAPPAVLGVNLYRAQEALGIEYVKKDADCGSNVYRKL